MYNIFNMGIGMAIIVAAEDVEKAMNSLTRSWRKTTRHRCSNRQ